MKEESIVTNKISKKAMMKEKNKEKLSVRDYITMALLLILVYIAYVAIGMPMAMTGIGNIFMHAVCALIWGTIFLLLYTKINKKWTVLIFGTILALIQVMSFWPTSIFLFVGGVIGELIWQKLDRKKFKTMAACFTVQTTSWFLGIAIPLMIITDLSAALAENYVEMYADVKVLLMGPLFFIALAAVILCSILGSFIGKLLLKKHFQKAGIV